MAPWPGSATTGAARRWLRAGALAAGLAVAGLAGAAPLSAQPMPGGIAPGPGADSAPGWGGGTGAGWGSDWGTDWGSDSGGGMDGGTGDGMGDGLSQAPGDGMEGGLAADGLPTDGLAADGLPAGMGADMVHDGGADLGPAPLILAPADAGRQAPSVSMLPEGGGINGFASAEPAPPPAPELSAANMPVVVEMFTAQGCSSCPPADTMLGMLAGQPDVLALSYHVDYWDYLGWPDSFARPEFTERQSAYANAAGERSVYTPQMIVEGQDTSVAPGPAQLMGLIDAHRYAPALVSVQREPTPEGERIEVSPLSELGPTVEVMLVRYAPERRVQVTAGENRGREVVYSNVVLGLQHLSWWDGLQPLRLTVRADLVSDGAYPDDTRHAVLIQQMRGPRRLPGPILAAIRLD